MRSGARPTPRDARRRRAMSRMARRASPARGSSGSRGGRSDRATRSRGRSAAARAAAPARAGTASAPRTRRRRARSPHRIGEHANAVDLDQHAWSDRATSRASRSSGACAHAAAGSSTAMDRAVRGVRRRTETRRSSASSPSDHADPGPGMDVAKSFTPPQRRRLDALEPRATRFLAKRLHARPLQRLRRVTVHAADGESKSLDNLDALHSRRHFQGTAPRC